MPVTRPIEHFDTANFYRQTACDIVSSMRSITFVTCHVKCMKIVFKKILYLCASLLTRNAFLALERRQNALGRALLQAA